LSTGLRGRSRINLSLPLVPHEVTSFNTLSVFFQFGADFADLRDVGDGLGGIADNADRYRQKSEFLLVTLTVFSADISSGIIFFVIKRRDLFVKVFNDLPAGVIDEAIVHNENKVVSADMPDKGIWPAHFTDDLDERPGQFPDDFISLLKTVNIVVHLEFVQVHISDGKFFFRIDAALEFFHNGGVQWN